MSKGSIVSQMQKASEFQVTRDNIDIFPTRKLSRSYVLFNM